MDEFDDIARLFRPLSFGAPEALSLLDDAAAIPMADGSMLIVTTDTVVEGVHTPLGEAPELIARKLLRTNLSDLAAKAAQPYGWFLNIAWPTGYGAEERERFTAGLAEDSQAFGLKLFGGDTVRTPGPLTATATLLGKAPNGRFIPRSGARPGDILLVSGTIGDAGLGLEVALGATLSEIPSQDSAWLLDRYRLPQPRLNLTAALLGHACACADVSDGLLADAGRIAAASGVGLEIDLEAMPLSKAASLWAEAQPDPLQARLKLATSGDDYELVCACRPEEAKRLCEMASAAGTPFTLIGRVAGGRGSVSVRFKGAPVVPDRLGYAHH